MKIIKRGKLWAIKEDGVLKTEHGTKRAAEKEVRRLLRLRAEWRRVERAGAGMFVTDGLPVRLQTR